MSPIALAGSARNSRGSNIYFIATLAILIGLFGLIANAHAQRVNLVDGAAIVTVFSGLVPDGQGRLGLDPDGISLRAFDLANVGNNTARSPIEFAELLTVKARSIGQVFAIAVDNAARPAVYLGATSLFGLYRTPDNSDWDPAMWGRNGGPGTIYRLHPDNGYQPEAFTDIRNGQRENSGPGLGDIAVDPISGLLFVSDLETGLIHSVDLQSGDMVETYDHGIDGRAEFLNPETELTESLESVPWNILGTGPGICGAESNPESARRFMSDPACWRYASFQRRVLALGIRHDAKNGETRLYYSIWASSALGDPNWDAGNSESRNSIWSIALDTAGRFDISDVRREIIMPASSASRDDREISGESQPVASIAFTEDGAMLVAERGVPLGYDQDDDERPLEEQGSARVLTYVLEDGQWVAETSGASSQNISSSGGVAPGYGYTRQGRIDPDNWGGTVWTTGDGICDSKSACGEDDFAGLQGIGRVEPDDTPLLVSIASIDQAPERLGDVVIFRLQTEAPANPQLGEPSPQQVADGIDLTLAMRANQSVCRPGSTCSFTLELGNQGMVTYRGQLMFTDTTNPNLSLNSISPGNWNCIDADGSYLCHASDITLPPRAFIELNQTFNVGPGIVGANSSNCAAIIWPDQGARAQVLAVQTALKGLGFDPGTPDGLSGPRTRAAVREAELTNGLRPTGEISENLMEILFGPGRGASPETDTDNNNACATVDLDIPPPPVVAGQDSDIHEKFQSRNQRNSSRAQVRTHDRSTSAFHERYSSSMYQGQNSRSVPIHRRPLSQFHQTDRSGRHDGTVSRSAAIHDPVVSQFHETYQSSLHNNRTSQRYPVHIVGRSEFHQTYRSWIHDGTVSRQVPAE
jgi:peptidoglycan hydrolase-like protein with peptidoglycan-binding domain